MNVYVDDDDVDFCVFNCQNVLLQRMCVWVFFYYISLFLPIIPLGVKLSVMNKYQ